LVPNNLRDNFDAGQYVETAYAGLNGYDATSGNQHAMMNINNARDIHGYTWEKWEKEDADAGPDCNTEIDLPEPFFAPVDLIGQFLANQDARTNFRHTNNDQDEQIVVWTFTHKVRTGEASDLFGQCDMTLHGAQATELAKINDWFTYDGNPIGDEVGDDDTITVRLDSDCKTLTLKFADITVSENDKIETGDGNTYTSAIDDSQHTTVSAAADGSN
jgi:hypothetical protein